MARTLSGDKRYDIPYGISSASLTIGDTALAASSVFYHGMSVFAGTVDTTVKIFDNATGTTGNVIDMVRIQSNKSIWIDRYIPVVAKSGMFISIVGSEAEGAVFYGPKG